jgi:hypothetical protein
MSLPSASGKLLSSFIAALQFTQVIRSIRGLRSSFNWGISQPASLNKAVVDEFRRALILGYKRGPNWNSARSSCRRRNERAASHPRLASGFQAVCADVSYKIFAGMFVGATMLDDGHRFHAVPFKAHPANQRTLHHQSLVEAGTAGDPRAPAA